MEFNGSQALIIILALTLTVGGLVFRQFTKWKRRRDLESALRTDDGSGEENGALRRDLESTSRTDHASCEEYDVFLSFRGPDTRKGFTSCLYYRLRDAGIRVFFDNEELRVGKEISTELLKALDKCRIYMPIFSKGYANSSWCLREVAHMVDRTSTSDGKKEILPIFYDVDPDDVQLKTKLYRKAIPKHKKNFGSDELKPWKKALVEVARIKGWDLNGKSQGEQIESIVEEVSGKLNTRHMIVTEHLVEDTSQIEEMMKLLDFGSGGVRFVGIHGMGGVGKTTLAKVMFNKLSVHFEQCSFLDDVRASLQPHGALLELQKKLLSDLTDHQIANQIKDVDGGIKTIKKSLSNKEVLIVLDDLDKKEQLEKLAGKADWFCSGSRIIITTRDESILLTQVGSSSKEVLNQPEEILRYEVRGMRFDLALHLFYKHAFRSDSTVEEYDALSREIVCTVGMLPLAVVVIGSNLFDWGKDLGHLDKREVWDETLKKLKQGPFEDVRDTLMISYEQLEDSHQEVFLDIACFFINADRTYSVIMWKDCGYFPGIAMSVLSQRSFIKISDDNRFWMHDQIRDFGRYIVLRVYPRKFCRVWIREDALKLLEKKKRNEDVVALSLTSNAYNHRIASEELAALPNLRFLRVKGIDFFGNFDNLLSKLRWFSWEITNKEFYAESFHFANLVVLDLSGSNIEDGWGGWSQIQMTKKLKVLDLTDCTKLRRTPDFSNFTSLETLVLAECFNLITIHPSISKLQLLETLNIKGCSSLGELPEEGTSLQSLKQIIIPELPSSLTSLALDVYPCQIIPDLSNLVNLEYLDLSFRRDFLRGTSKWKELISPWKNIKSIHQLSSSLSTLKLTYITPLPQFSSFGKLSELAISSCSMAHFPALEHLENLRELSVEGCASLVRTPDLSCLKNLGTLHLIDLQGLEEVQGLGELESLVSLKITCCGSIEMLPNLSKLEKLQHFDLECCPRLRAVEGLSGLRCLTYVTIIDCDSLESLPDLPTWKKLDTDRESSETSDPCV